MTGRTTLLFALLSLLSIGLSGQGFLSTNGQAIVNEEGDTIILRGMGLGGWMVQEGYMLQTASFANPQHQIRAAIEGLIGESATNDFYEAWLTNHVQKVDIDSLKLWGFNSVRLPMHYNLYTLPIQDEPVPGEQTWLDKGFELTDSLISWCAQNEMYVILDLHAAPGGQGYDEGISDYDPSKPSLWESFDNQQKTVALWRRLAERYVDEPWVAGYDLINEPNWDLPGGTLLRSVYEQITTAIREVDTNHIIFIEGNWFANDFTGLTPPWDDNMVYSPHKYWSFNDQGSIQWVLDLRNQYNIPLYLGESGENSNVWFKEAIELLEANDIGWAWWPMKKVESIAGPLSVLKTPEYQSLLNYWNNGGSTPNTLFAQTTLMELADNYRMENCFFQKDVIDAMFRQREEGGTIPFNTQSIPGVVYATDFDLGAAGVAYQDSDIANYQVSTGQFTAWNQGWSYRNDGVDIENSQDALGNGFNVGWTADGEWMEFDVEVASTAVYEVRVRVASATGGGNFNFSADGAAVSIPFYVASTGGWQSWQDRVVPNVVLDSSIEKLRFHVPEGGYNVSRFEFVEIGPTTDIPTDFLSAFTIDPQTIQLNINKPLSGPIPASPADFQLFANGSPLTIASTELDVDNPRIITFAIDEILDANDVIRITYTGTNIEAIDETSLVSFFLEDVQNTLNLFLPIPGRVEAEDFIDQSGTQLENTTDTGGGQNAGFLDIGDYLDYQVSVTQEGFYNVTYRTASLASTGGIELQLIDENGNATSLSTTTFAPTGGWQSWTSTTSQVALPAGAQRLRVLISQSQFNLNWMDFTYVGPTDTEENEVFAEGLNIFSNPSSGQFNLRGDLVDQQDLRVLVRNQLGQLVYADVFRGVLNWEEVLNLHFLADGTYTLTVQTAEGIMQSWPLIKIAGN